MKNKIFILLSILIIKSTFSASLEYGATIRNLIDNRESYASVLKSQTFLLSSIDMSAGVAFDSSNGIYFGVTYTKEYGESTPWDNFKPLIYYHFNGNNTEVYAGAFSRFDVKPYPTFLINDSLAHFSPNIEGIHIERGNSKYFENIWIDWTSQKKGSNREAFRTGVSGAFNANGFSLSHYLLYYHLAHSDIHPIGESVEDNAGLFIALGKEFGKMGITDSLNFSLNTHISFDRNRGVTSTWHTPVGLSVLSHVRLGKKFGVGVLYYRVVYKDGGGWLNLTFGETFYKAQDFGRLSLSWYPVLNKYVTSELKIDFNYVEGAINSRQVFKLVGSFRGNKKMSR